MPMYSRPYGASVTTAIMTQGRKYLGRMCARGKWEEGAVKVVETSGHWKARFKCELVVVSGAARDQTRPDQARAGIITRGFSFA